MCVCAYLGGVWASVCLGGEFGLHIAGVPPFINLKGFCICADRHIKCQIKKTCVLFYKHFIPADSVFMKKNIR